MNGRHSILSVLNLHPVQCQLMGSTQLRSIPYHSILSVLGLHRVRSQLMGPAQGLWFIPYHPIAIRGFFSYPAIVISIFWNLPNKRVSRLQLAQTVSYLSIIRERVFNLVTGTELLTSSRLPSNPPWSIDPSSVFTVILKTLI